MHRGGYTEYMNKNTTGFTIIELLITIVVIAILAAISVIAYNNIQQRAKNAAIIYAVGQTIKSIQAYVAQEGQYPFTVDYGVTCVTSVSGCTDGEGGTVTANATFTANMQTVSLPPTSVPRLSRTGWQGITYIYHGNRTMDGQRRPVVLIYRLQGTNQPCGVSGVATANGPSMISSTPGYTDGNRNGDTLCVVSIP